MVKTFFVGAMIVLSVVLFACSSSTSPSTMGTLSLSSRYSSLQPPAPKFSWVAKSGFAASADSIKLTRARFVLKDIKFKTDIDSMNFKSGPIVLELNLGSATQTINVTDAKFTTYRRIEFDVHRTESTEVSLLAAAERAAFADFLAGERYSIILEGIVYRTGQNDTTFVYRSKIDAQQKIDLVPPLTIVEANPVANVTMLISSGGWFIGPLGLLDPTSPSSGSIIDENLKNAIRVFKDNDKDGSKDSG